MKRIYILEGLDCAHCAEEIRAEVEKDERVKYRLLKKRNI